jgi:GAF domain-containing protein
MTINLLIGISAGLAALVAGLLALLVARRRDGAAMEGRLGELERTLAVVEAEGRRNSVLVGLAASIDLDEVFLRVLDAAVAVGGADAALVMVTDPAGGKPVVATVGLSAEEAERHAATGVAGGLDARTIALSYEYPKGEGGDEGEQIRSGLAAPLPGADEPIGYLAIFTRDQAKVFQEEEQRELEALAVHAGPPIENARRFREARRLADLDALTGLHNRRFFHETLAREVARAHRYTRRLALMVLDLDDF